MSGIADLLASACKIYSYILLARALVSWIPNLGPDNPAVKFLYAITEPVLAPIRKLVPPIGGTMDISIMIAFFGLIILEQILRSVG
jgi:YggT family protein